MGFVPGRVAADLRALLPHDFTLTGQPKPAGGMVSVTLSVRAVPHALPWDYQAWCPALPGLSSL